MGRPGWRPLGPADAPSTPRFRIAADLAWALATLLVLPIIIVEGRMPREAIAESVSLVKGRLGLTVRTKIRLFPPRLVVMVIGILVCGAGFVTFLHYRHETPEWAVMGLLLATIGLLAAVGATCVQGLRTPC